MGVVTVGLAQRPEVVLEEGSQGWDQLGEGPTEWLNPSEPTRGAMHTIAGDPSTELRKGPRVAAMVGTFWTGCVPLAFVEGGAGDTHSLAFTA